MLRTVTLKSLLAASLALLVLPAIAQAQAVKFNRVAGVQARTADVSKLDVIRDGSFQPATGKLLKVHVYLDGTWPGKGGVWVTGATVTITRLTRGERLRRTILQTDQYGDASFYVPPGEYKIFVEKAGRGSGVQTHVVPETGLFVSFPLSMPAGLANFPKDKAVLYPKYKLPVPGPR